MTVALMRFPIEDPQVPLRDLCLEAQRGLYAWIAVKRGSPTGPPTFHVAHTPPTLTVEVPASFPAERTLRDWYPEAMA